MANKKFGFAGLNLILWHKKINLIGLVLISLLLWFIVFSLKETYINNKLKKEGKITTAVIIDTSEKGGVYKFRVNNKFIIGFFDEDHLNIGDSLTIQYLEENPNINHSLDIVN